MSNTPDSKPTNPKDAIAVDKLPLSRVSPFVKAYQAIAHFLGNVKYGAWNWRAAGARCSIYLDALERHIDLFKEGEWYDSADGTPHLANAMACIGIIIDSYHMGKLIDDRQPPNTAEYKRLREEFEALMKQIRVQYADKAPHHWTQADEVKPEPVPLRPGMPLVQMPRHDYAAILRDPVNLRNGNRDQPWGPSK